MKRPQHRNPLWEGNDSERRWFARRVRTGEMGSTKVAALGCAAGLFLAYFKALEVWGMLLCFSVSVFRDSSLTILRAPCLSKFAYIWITTCHVVRSMMGAEIIFHRSKQK